MSDQTRLNLDPIHDLLFGASKALTLKLAIEANLFTCIADGSCTAPEIASAIKSSESGIRALADALCALGFLEKDNQNYALTTLSEAFLVKGRPTYYGDSYLDAILPWAWPLDGPARDAIRSGEGVGKSITGADAEALWSSWAEAHAVFWENIAHSARAMWEKISDACSLPPAPTVLDIACGHAIWTLVLLQRYPQAVLTAVDRHPSVVNVAERIATKLDVRSRLTTEIGDLETYEAQSNTYDLVYIGGVLYLYHGDRAVEVLRRAHHMLKPGGCLVVNTLIADPNRTTAQGALIQALRRCLYDGGTVHTLAEYRTDLSVAGFSDVQLVGDDLLLARS